MPTPVLQWMLAAGAGTSAVNTGSEAGGTGTITAGASGAWTSDAQGNGYSMAETATIKTADIDGTALETALVGVKTVTLEMVFTCSSTIDPMIFGISAPGPWDLAFYKIDGQDGNYGLWWADSTNVSLPFGATAADGTKRIIHVVVDTARTTERVRGYVAGTIDVTDNSVTQDSTFPSRTSGDDRIVAASNAIFVDESRFMLGTLWYAAIYNVALTAGEVAANAAALATSHDTDPNAGGGGGGGLVTRKLLLGVGK